MRCSGSTLQTAYSSILYSSSHADKAAGALKGDVIHLRWQVWKVRTIGCSQLECTSFTFPLFQVFFSGGKRKVFCHPLLPCPPPHFPCTFGVQDFGTGPTTFLSLTLCHLLHHHWPPLLPLSLSLSCVHSFSPLICFWPHLFPSEQFPALSQRLTRQALGVTLPGGV